MPRPAFLFTPNHFSLQTSSQRLQKPFSKHSCRHRATSPCMKLISHEVIEQVFQSGDRTISKYKLTLEIPAQISKDARRTSISEAKKRARFPGFRPGQIPPFMMKELNEFVLIEGISDMLKEATEELGLKMLEGETAEPELGVEITDMMDDFQVGKDYRVECTVSLQKDGEEAEVEKEKGKEEGKEEVEVEAEAVSS